MTLVLKSQLKPPNASCAWADRCRFWRSIYGTVCPLPLRIGVSTSSPTFTRIAIAGDFLGATPISNICPGSSPYISIIGGSEFNFYIWKALADGAWSSSASFTIYGFRDGYTGTVTLTGEAGSTNEVSPDPADVFLTTFFPTVGVYEDGCPSVAVATLTVYDDGTYTLT